MTKIPVAKIVPNPEQPRRLFDQEELAELAASIMQSGQQTPIQVTPPNKDGFYTLIAGERRWRAHKLKNMKTIEAVIRKITSKKDMLIEAAVENIQRKNMNVVEEADSYLRMKNEYGMSVKDISKRIGVYEVRIYNLLKIASLEEPIKALIAQKRLPGSTEAVDALLSVPEGKNRIDLAQALADRGATIKMIVSAAAKLNFSLQNKPISQKETPAVVAAKALTKRTRRKPILDKPQLSKWNALEQAGMVPPYPLFVKHVQNTCDSCSLRSVASPATCSDCPLAQFVKTISEDTNVY
jgi:ParB family chromosome partitioning protein